MEKVGKTWWYYLRNSWTSCCMKLSKVSQPKDFVSFLVPTGLSWNCKFRW